MKIRVAGTPVPNRDIEQRSNGCGPVITYRLTEEELKKMREKEGPVNEGTLGDMILRALDYYTGRKSDVPVADDDPVNHPAHYTAGKVECIDAIEAATTGLEGGLAYCTGCAIKYLWRWSRKGGVEDLRKARWYVDRLIKEVEGE